MQNNGDYIMLGLAKGNQLKHAIFLTLYLPASVVEAQEISNHIACCYFADYRRFSPSTFECYAAFSASLPIQHLVEVGGYSWHVVQSGQKIDCEVSDKQKITTVAQW